MISTHEVVLSNSAGDRKTRGFVRIQTWSQQDRLKRAIKLGGLTLGLAVVSVFVPILHFVLVPALLLGAPFVSYWAYFQEKVLLDGEGECPNCGAPFLVAKGKPEFPLDDLCTQCHLTVTGMPFA